MDYADPEAVANAYVEVRFTYQAGDTAGYLAALAAPQVTTADFAARSAPTPEQVTQAQRAHDASTVVVTSATPSLEAPNDDATQYVTVAFTTTATYTGSPPDGQQQDHVWSLRLVDDAGRWLVDAVVVGDE